MARKKKPSTRSSDTLPAPTREERMEERAMLNEHLGQHQLRLAVQAYVPHGVRALLRDFDGQYDGQVAETFLQLVSAGLTLANACGVLGMEQRWARTWIADDEDGMRGRYTTALALQAESWADEMINLADEVTPDPAFVAKARLRIETRKWLMAKNNGLRFGDKSTLTVEGSSDKPLTLIVDTMTPHQAAELYAETLRSPTLLPQLPAPLVLDEQP